jgi:hypothetical protein
VTGILGGCQLRKSSAEIDNGPALFSNFLLGRMKNVYSFQRFALANVIEFGAHHYDMHDESSLFQLSVMTGIQFGNMRFSNSLMNICATSSGMCTVSLKTNRMNSRRFC